MELNIFSVCVGGRFREGENKLATSNFVMTASSFFLLSSGSKFIPNIFTDRRQEGSCLELCVELIYPGDNRVVIPCMIEFFSNLWLDFHRFEALWELLCC